jgi:hypothetical protein
MAAAFRALIEILQDFFGFRSPCNDGISCCQHLRGPVQRPHLPPFFQRRDRILCVPLRQIDLP